MANNRYLHKIIEISLIIIGFVMTNITAFAVSNLFPTFTSQTSIAWPIIAFCLILLMLQEAKSQGFLAEFGKNLKRQVFLVLFVVFGVVSLAWSVLINASIFELSFLMVATAYGVYFAVRYSTEKFMAFLRYFGMAAIILSFILIFTLPSIAKLNNPIYNGAWCGIFWHRNHLGSIMAFLSALFLLKAWMDRKKSVSLAVNIVFFLLAAVLIAGSRSATGLLLFVFLNGLEVLLLVWLNFRSRLTKKHYFIILAAAVLIIALCLVNLDLIFGLVGRNTSLTGRVPLWEDLVTRVWAQKPLLGYGYGAFWNQESARLSLQARHRWAYPILFADNGYLDILLNTGLIGLLLFLGFFVTTGIRSTRVFIKNGTITSLFPLLVFVYFLVANISYSFLLETEQFAWMLLVIAGVSTVKHLEEAAAPG